MTRKTSRRQPRSLADFMAAMRETSAIMTADTAVTPATIIPKKRSWMQIFQKARTPLHYTRTELAAWQMAFERQHPDLLATIDRPPTTDRTAGTAAGQDSWADKKVAERAPGLSVTDDRSTT